MSRLDWVVRVVTVQENVPDSCFIVGIAQDESGGGGHFVFQCGLEAPGEQAQRLGLDSYCTLSEAGGVQYGGVRRVLLSADRVQFFFDPEAAEELGLPEQEIEIGIECGVNIDRLREGLRRVLTYGNPGKVPELVGF